MLFTFPSQYLFAIGLSVVFSLGGWCRQIQTGFLRSRPTQDTPACHLIACTGLSPPAACLPRHFQFSSFHGIGVLQPRACRNIPGLGSFPFAHHYLGNHCYFLFLRLLRCFSSSGLPPIRITAIPGGWVAPFGHPRIKRLFAPPRGFSQLITSFFASESQGIPHALLVTYSFFTRFVSFLSSRSRSPLRTTAAKLFC